MRLGLVHQLDQHLLLLRLEPRVIDLPHRVGEQPAVLDVPFEQLGIAAEERHSVVHAFQHLRHQRLVHVGTRAHEPQETFVDRGRPPSTARRVLPGLQQLDPHARDQLFQIVALVGGALEARLPVAAELVAGRRHPHLGLQRLDLRLQLVAVVDDVLVGPADLRQLLLRGTARFGRRFRFRGPGVAVRLEHCELLLVLVAVAGLAQQLRELAFDFHPDLDRLGDLRLRVADLLAEIVQRRLAAVQLAPDHARGVARFGQLPFELGDPLLRGLRRAVLLLDGRGRLLGPTHLGDDLTGLRQLLHQLAALLPQLRELDVLLLELVVQLLFLARGPVQLLPRGVQLFLRVGHLLVA
ncbi:MAG: hypothetical protein AUI48_08830 [Chloroflexi bacterium 13_1_40CM_2_68_14]|nr:MAG: hypothetical protein AUI48_08830 [Chloroflexi bacterium 13_1_40CM_2_68_14]